MASKTTLTAKNLEALGAARLAELLIEISTGNAAAKRQLRFELAGKESPAEAAREVRKRLASLVKSRTFVDWQRRQSLVADLDGQRRAILNHVAKADPSEALDLLWRFKLSLPRYSRGATTAVEPYPPCFVKPVVILVLSPNWRSQSRRLLLTLRSAPSKTTAMDSMTD